jgi:hypothetical protein
MQLLHDVFFTFCSGPFSFNHAQHPIVLPLLRQLDLPLKERNFTSCKTRLSTLPNLPCILHMTSHKQPKEKRKKKRMEKKKK